MTDALGGAFRDVADGFRLAPLWLKLGLDQTFARFHRTLLGPFWMAGGLLAMAAALSIVYGSLFGTNWKAGFPYLISGILVWFFISGVIGEAATLFISAAGTMQIQKLPLTFHVLVHMQRAAVNFAFQLGAFWLAVIVIGVAAVPHWTLLLGLPLLFVNCLMISLLIGMAAARFRDIVFLTGFALQMGFFLTPILWPTSNLTGAKKAIADYNPIWHLLEIVRQPLLGFPPVYSHWVWSVLSAAILAMMCIISLMLYRKRVVFWI